MPCYPALALLLGSAMAGGGKWVRGGTRVLAVILAVAGVAAMAIYLGVRNIPAPGDISSALSHNPGAYKLSLGHIEDLNFSSFAYLRTPLFLAGAAFLLGALGTWRFTGQRAFFTAALWAVVFFQAARMAMVVFDPYLSSRPLAEALLKAPPGKLIVNHHYYTFSSIFFYTNRSAPLLNGRINNLVYGSYAPGAPDVFLTNQQWKALWLAPERCYLIAGLATVPDFEALVGRDKLITVAESGGKVLLSNRAPLE